MFDSFLIATDKKLLSSSPDTILEIPIETDKNMFWVIPKTILMAFHLHSIENERHPL